MGIVTGIALVFTVRSRDSDTALLFLRSLVDFIDALFLGKSLHGEDVQDRSSKSCLTMVNVPDSTDVYVRLGALKLLCHNLLLKRIIYKTLLVFLGKLETSKTKKAREKASLAIISTG